LQRKALSAPINFYSGYREQLQKHQMSSNQGKRYTALKREYREQSKKGSKIAELLSKQGVLFGIYSQGMSYSRIGLFRSA